ncbi:FixH family protein [Breoghania sp. JC706]|uniref:FixH family protein n=1 Tax=Breoghania sp. JC706 TaxID=3117732 RepID=UPI00300914A6
MSTIAPSMTPDAKPERRLTGRGVLAWLVGFFLVIFAANGAFIYYALSSWTGLEVESSYKAGQAYQGVLDEAARQAARGWQVNAHIDRDGGGRAAMRIVARDKTGAPLSGLLFTARLERPTHRAEDRTLTLAERETGIYVGTLDDLEPGQWDLHLEGTGSTGVVFRSRNRLFLKDE